MADIYRNLSVLIVEDIPKHRTSLINTILQISNEIKISTIDKIGNYLESGKTNAAPFIADHLQHDVIILDLDVPFSDKSHIERERFRKYGKEWGGIYLAEILSKNPKYCDKILVDSAHLSDIEQNDYFTGVINELMNQNRLLKWSKTDDDKQFLISRIKEIHEAKKAGIIWKLSDFNAIKFAACTNHPVLVLGASGSGKEGFAKWIHREWCEMNGKKPDELPFISVNCSFPEHLLLKDLFGYVKNSFPNAETHQLGFVLKAAGLRDDQKGLFIPLIKKKGTTKSYINWIKQNNKRIVKHDNRSNDILINNENIFGTLFLDEIGELTTDLQSMLLRVISDKTKELKPVGFEGTVKFENLRIIAATSNPNWFHMAGQAIPIDNEQKKPKLDLYFRLAWHRIIVGDIQKEEVESFIQKSNFKDYWHASGKNYLKDLIEKKHFHGSRRELKSVVEMAGEFVKNSDKMGFKGITQVEKEVIDKVWKPSQISPEIDKPKES